VPADQFLPSFAPGKITLLAPSVDDTAARVTSYTVSVVFINHSDRRKRAKGELTVIVSSVTAFTHLRVNLSPLDQMTAQDLFGKVLARHYYVARVRIFNDARSADKSLLQSTVLAFASSLEVGVVLEKRWVDLNYKDASLPTPPADTSQWSKVVAEADFADIVDADTLGRLKSEAALSKVTDATKKSAAALFDAASCADVFRYRPISTDSMAITVDQRYARSTRGVIFTALAAVGSAAGFIGAISNVGSSYGKTLSAYSTILVPGLTAVWPNLTEPQRQNILAYGMKGIEEVPFGSEIARYVFFPKDEIVGVLPHRAVRISAICPYYFRIEVAVVRKEARGTASSGGPNS
jgi:hypothetical protein